VFECIQALLKGDSEVVVKRSAAVCATLLLRGLSKDCLKVATEAFFLVVEFQIICVCEDLQSSYDVHVDI